ncbi:MAG: ArsR family transcriptional regulator [Thaumarchaeota archaeon]|nr:ArsR family transcriptional regulator [Nitrososphaerota archaeon]
MSTLDRYAELLKRAKLAKLETLTAWYSLFGMKEDPFLSQISRDEIDYFVDREGVVDEIVYDVGVASRGIPITTLIVGPYGSGKTSILLYVENVLQRLRQRNPEEYSFTGEFRSCTDLFQEGEGDEDVQPWIKVCGKERDYLFVDEAKPRHIGAIMRNFTRTRLKVFAISPLDLPDAYSSIPVDPKILFLQPFNLETMREMLQRRIDRVLKGEKRTLSLLDIFEEEALKVIHKYSMGVPLLQLKCASKSLKLLRDLHGEKSLSDRQRKVTTDIATEACKILKCFHAFHEFKKISRVKIEVLQQILDQGKTPTEISAIMGKDRTTISRHLNELRRLGLVEFRARGRESVYRATEAVRIRFEIEHMPEGRWELASA